LSASTSRFVVAVVDDDHSVLKSIEYLLESADYVVHVFTSAAALLESEYLQQIDCLISDIDMPTTDGFELLRRVGEMRPGLPAILITGYPDRLQRATAGGGNDPPIFTKPFQGEQLLEAVRNARRIPTR
jgi:FixJ family two-component response regulator